MLPEVFWLGVSEPPSVDQGQVSDVGLLGGDQLGEDDQLRLGHEHHRGGVDLDLLPGIKLEKRKKSETKISPPEMALKSRREKLATHSSHRLSCCHRAEASYGNSFTVIKWSALHPFSM